LAKNTDLWDIDITKKLSICHPSAYGLPPFCLWREILQSQRNSPYRWDSSATKTLSIFINEILGGAVQPISGFRTLVVGLISQLMKVISLVIPTNN
jgi:hypothetical protein